MYNSAVTFTRRDDFIAELVRLLNDNLQAYAIFQFTATGSRALELYKNNLVLKLWIGSRTTYGDTCQQLLQAAWNPQFPRALRLEYYGIYSGLRKEYEKYLSGIGVVV